MFAYCHGIYCTRKEAKNRQENQLRCSAIQGSYGVVIADLYIHIVKLYVVAMQIPSSGYTTCVAMSKRTRVSLSGPGRVSAVGQWAILGRRSP